MSQKVTFAEAQKKLEYYCSYQERCHAEVVQKCYDLGLNANEVDLMVVHLIENNYLNEERFARSFARGKFRIKFWGKSRIVNELKFRKISSPNIKLALTEIDEDEYEHVFNSLAERHWNSILEKNTLKKRKKFCDYLLRKGWETDRIYEKVKELEK
jgi:regulatory protein